MEQSEIDYIEKALVAHSGPRKQLEIELRFGQFVKDPNKQVAGQPPKFSFQPGVTWIEFANIRKHLETHLGIKPKFRETTVHNYTDGLRSITKEDGTVIWQRKNTVLRHRDVRDYGYRLSSSYEQKDNGDRPNIAATDIRYRKRYSYKVNGCRLDLTELLNKPRGTPIKYEVEIEFKGNHEDANVKLWQQCFNLTFCSMFDTHLVYSQSHKRALIEHLHSIFGVDARIQLDRSILAEARDLRKRDVVHGGLVGNSRTTYNVTSKVDGIHRLLVITEKLGVWLFNPPHEFNYIIVNPAEYGLFSHLETVMDGELLPVDRRIDESLMNIKYLYYPYDCICYNGKDTRSFRHLQRYGKIMGIPDSINAAGVEASNFLTIRTKDILNFVTVDDFYIKVGQILNALPSREYKNDGLIFTPESADYIPSVRGEAAVGRRTLTSRPDVCKWKPLDKMTIDLRIDWLPDGSLVASSIMSEIDRMELPIKQTSYMYEIPNPDGGHPTRIYVPGIQDMDMGYATDYQSIGEGGSAIFNISKPPGVRKYGLVKKLHYKPEVATKANRDLNALDMVVRAVPGAKAKLTTVASSRQQRRLVDVNYYRLVVMRKNKYVPFTNAPIDSNDNKLRQFQSGSIYEFEWNGEVFLPLKPRTDKDSPNGRDVVENIWKVIRDPITEKDLRGQTLTFMYRYHNRIKSKLFDLLSPGKTLSDWGSGKGGDIEKWENLGKVLAIEPNVDNIAEFKRRAATSRNRHEIQVLNSNAEDSEVVTSAIHNYFGGRVDAISFMHTLTFFWKDKETLTKLVQTILSNLNNKGVILFIALNGDAVEQALDPIGNVHPVQPGTESVDLLQGRVELGLQPKPAPGNGREMRITLLGSKTVPERQQEYLVRFNDLFKMLRPYGIKLGGIYRAKGERLMSPAEIYLSGLYSFGYLYHDGSVELPNLVQPTLNQMVVPVPVSALQVVQQQVVPTQAVQQQVVPTQAVPTLEQLLNRQPKPAGSDIDALDSKLISVDDNYQPLASQWMPNMVRIACLNNNSSMIHCILKGSSPTYQALSDPVRREQLARAFRRDLSLAMSGESRQYPGRAAWDAAGQGYYVRRVVGGSMHLTRDNFANYIASTNQLGHDYISIVSQVLKLDVFVVRRIANEFATLGTNSRLDTPRDAVVLLAIEDGHYELLAYDNGINFQTLWKTGSPSIDFLRQKFNVQPKEPFDPIANLRSVLPQGTVVQSMNFNPNDPYLKLARDAGYTVV